MMTSGMHRRPFEGRHLVKSWFNSFHILYKGGNYLPRYRTVKSSLVMPQEYHFQIRQNWNMLSILINLINRAHKKKKNILWCFLISVFLVTNFL